MTIPENKRTGNVYSNMAAYIEAKEAYAYAPGKLINGEMMVKFNGKWYTTESFKAMMPNPDSLLIRNGSKGENCCKKITSNCRP